MSFQEAVRLLHLEPVGTFFIRLREMLPGSFALCFVMPRNKVVQIPIMNNQPSGYKIKVRNCFPSLEYGNAPKENDGQDDADNYATFERLHDIVTKYDRILREPFLSTIAKEPWFYGDLTATETVGLLTGQPVGTFLLRFSAQHPHCLSAAYVDASGDITHALITKSTLGYHHADDDIFPTVHALLTAYQSVLMRTCIEPDVVQQLCEEVRTQLRIFKAADEVAHDDSQDDAEVRCP